MATAQCPWCGGPLLPEHISMREGVALCPACGKVSRLSSLVNEDAALLLQPPGGCSVEESNGQITLRARFERSRVVFAILFICIWFGIVGSMAWMMWRWLLTDLHVLGPAPQTPSGKTTFTSMDVLGHAVGCLFTTFFLGIGLLLIGRVMLLLLGSLVVIILGDEAKVFVGVGRFGRTRRFQLSRTRNINAATSSAGESTLTGVVVDADRSFTFGAGLSSPSARWMAAVLRRIAAARTPSPGQLS